MRDGLKRIAKVFYHVHLPGDFIEPVYHEIKHLPQGSPYLRVLFGSLVGPLARMVGSRRRHYRVVTNERIVELPFVLQRLAVPPGSDILEFGNAKSRLSLELASLGYRVTAVDLRPYPYTHPNLRCIPGDFRDIRLPEASFNAVVAVSAIEHCGMAGYGEEAFERGDHRIVAELHRVLIPGGHLLITVPYGRAGVSDRGWRVYDAAALEALLRAFEVREARYFRGVSRSYWIPVTAGDLADIDSATLSWVQGVACIWAVKRGAEVA